MREGFGVDMAQYRDVCRCDGISMAHLVMIGECIGASFTHLAHSNGFLRHKSLLHHERKEMYALLSGRLYRASDRK